jgi:Glyoxalase-like domain
VSVLVDHLVVAAATLQQGVAWCEATFGITPGPGGRHPLMGTHNRLFKVASAVHPDAYLEIIAIDPEAPPPDRVRWFGLDEPALRARLQHGPRLVHVVARSTMLQAHRLGLIGAGLDPGNPVQAGRDTPHGRLAWQILVRDDGVLPCGGALPTLIQWQGTHPATHMPDSGVTLRTLALNGVPEGARDVLCLRDVFVQSRPGPALVADFDTPLGPLTLTA